VSQIDAALNASGPPEKSPASGGRRNSNSGKDTMEPTPKRPKQTEKATPGSRSEKKDKKEKHEKKEKGRKEDKDQDGPSHKKRRK